MIIKMASVLLLLPDNPSQTAILKVTRSIVGSRSGSGIILTFSRRENSHHTFAFIVHSDLRYTFKGSFHNETFLCRGLKVRDVSIGSTPGLCFLDRDLRTRRKE